MLVDFAVYSALFFLLFLYGRVLQVRAFRHDLALKGGWAVARDWAGTGFAALMFVAAWGLVMGTPLVHRVFWIAYLVVSLGTMLFSARFIRGLQAEHGPRVGRIAYLVNTALVLPMDAGIAVYAFLSPDIWAGA